MPLISRIKGYNPLSPEHCAAKKKSPLSLSRGQKQQPSRRRCTRICSEAFRALLSSALYRAASSVSDTFSGVCESTGGSPQPFLPFACGSGKKSFTKRDASRSIFFSTSFSLSDCKEDERKGWS